MEPAIPTPEATGPVLRIRRGGERAFEDFGWTDNWMTFSFGEYDDPEWRHFGPLRVIVENHIQLHSGFPTHAHRDVEIVTYVAAGVLTHADSFGHAGGIGPGEMQLISAGSGGMIHSEENAGDVVEHNLQCWLVPDRHGTTFAYHQLGFTPEERRGQLRLYVSPDARDGSMPIHTDAFIYAGLFAPGDVVEHVLGPGRGAWIQLVRGTVRVFGARLAAGDGVGITSADRLALEFDDETELVLFDLGMDAPMIWR